MYHVWKRNSLLSFNESFGDKCDLIFKYNHSMQRGKLLDLGTSTPSSSTITLYWFFSNCWSFLNQIVSSAHCRG